MDETSRVLSIFKQVMGELNRRGDLKGKTRPRLLREGEAIPADVSGLPVADMSEEELTYVALSALAFRVGKLEAIDIPAIVQDALADEDVL